MKKFIPIFILFVGNGCGFSVATNSRLKRENEHFVSQEFQELGRAIHTLSATFETKMNEIKTELRNEIIVTKAEIQNKLDQILSQAPNGLIHRLKNLQESITNITLQGDKVELKLEKLDKKINSCNSMIISAAKTKTLANSTRLTVDTTAHLEQVSELRAEYLDVTLPTKESGIIPFYDGADSIYLFGEFGRPTLQKIYKFSISTETLQHVGTLPAQSSAGTVQSDRFGNIFYFGGNQSSFMEVYKFDRVTNATALVAMLPWDVANSVSFKYNDTVFILGGDGQDNELLAFNMDTLNYSTVSDNVSFYVKEGAGVRVGNKAFIFDDTESFKNRQALELNLDTYEMTQVGPETLPVFDSTPSVVWDGHFIYIIGGYENKTGRGTGGMIQFNPRTYENKFIPVSNFPRQGSNYFPGTPASVFVPGRNKIYCFGGMSYNSSRGWYVRHDEIFTIDLSPLNSIPSEQTMAPQFPDCNTATNGFYPHPTDCSLFIGCRDEMMTIFSCSAPLLFNPETKGCDFPHQVECSSFCQDKSDGSYPHPQESVSYIICRDKVTNVFECSAPLLFDPVKLHCDYPEVVSDSTAV